MHNLQLADLQLQGTVWSIRATFYGYYVFEHIQNCYTSELEHTFNVKLKSAAGKSETISFPLVIKAKGFFIFSDPKE